MTDLVDWKDETLRTLDELAQIAFPKDAGVTGKTLQRLAREGKLVVYRPGKAYLSTLANLKVALAATRPKPSMLRPAETPAVDFGLSEAALDCALAKLRGGAQSSEPPGSAIARMEARLKALS